MCDQTRIEEICEEREPVIGDAWTKKCSVPPNIRNEVLKEVLLHTSSPKVSSTSLEILKLFHVMSSLKKLGTVELIFN